MTVKKAPALKPAKVAGGTKSSGGMIRALGRRKTASARLRLTPNGSGQFVVNGKPCKEYFGFSFWTALVTEPLPLSGLEGTADISVRVQGGGLKGQAEAVRLALSRAIIELQPDLRSTIKKMGWLTRDPREKERKKPGLKRARRAPQWQKR